MRKLLRNILSQRLIDFYKKQKSNSKLNQRQVLKNSNQVVTSQMITDVLKQQGITKGDTIMLHSSLSKLGYVEGGAETVITAFLELVDKDGTLVMPSFPAIGFNYDYLKSNPVFDVLHTPSKMGVITDVFCKNQLNVVIICYGVVFARLK